MSAIVVVPHSLFWHSSLWKIDENSFVKSNLHLNSANALSFNVCRDKGFRAFTALEST